MPEERLTTSPWVVGCNYAVRTKNWLIIGYLDVVHDQEIVLRDVVRLQDSGRLGELLVSGLVGRSVEQIPRFLIVNRNAIEYATEWPHPL